MFTRSEGYLLYQWPWGTGKYTNNNCGVTLALDTKRFSSHHVVQTYKPPDALQGRAGALRVKCKGCCDFWFCVLYCPVNPRDRQQRQAMKALTKWLAQQLRDLPARTTPIIMMDANGRVGLLELDNQVVGPHNADVPNWNGREIMKVSLSLYIYIYTHVRRCMCICNQRGVPGLQLLLPRQPALLRRPTYVYIYIYIYTHIYRERDRMCNLYKSTTNC